MKPKITLNTDKDVYEWQRDKMELISYYEGLYYWYDYKNDKLYQYVVNERILIETTKEELAICYGHPAKNTICFLGKGEISAFAHFSPASNGYPEMPWGNKRYDHVYILNALLSIDDFHKCTFTYYDTTSNMRYEPAFITDENIKLCDIVDPNYIYKKLSYEEHQTLLKNLKKASIMNP